jgi:hypothetical protein
MARDFDQFTRHLIRETSTFKSTKVVGCRVLSISTRHRPAIVRKIHEHFARSNLYIDAVNRLRKRKRTTSNNSKQKTLLFLRLVIPVLHAKLVHTV